jgi:hypothetical protein
MMTGVIRDINRFLYGGCYDGTPRETIIKQTKKKVGFVSKWLSKNKFSSGKTLTYIDFVLYECVEFLDFMYEGKLYDEFPSF